MWLSVLLSIVLFIWIITFGSYLYSTFIDEDRGKMFFNLFYTVSGLCFFALGYFVLLMPHRYDKIHGIFESDKDEKYKKNPISILKKEEYINKIKYAVEEKKLYLESEISSKDFASASGVPLHHLSQILNDIIGKNFYSFINEYRVEYAADMLKNDPEANILSVCYQSGFNSKSVFNDVFKKYKKTTPTAFRNRYFKTISKVS